MRKLILFLSVLMLSCVFALSTRALAQARYQLKQKYMLGGDGGWHYITYDPVGKRLFISRSTRVMVVDPVNGSIIAEIPDTAGVHGIALAQDMGKGFISNGSNNTVTVFDLKTLKETAKIRTERGENPGAILYDPASKHIFTFNGRSNNATVIDADKGAVVGNIALSGKPGFAVADGMGKIYVVIEDKNQLINIDAGKATVLNIWPLPGCEIPAGLAVDAKHRRLFVGCYNDIMAIVNSDIGKIIATVPIGKGVESVDFDPGTGLALSSNADGTLTVVHEDSADRFTVVQNAETQKLARIMALNPANHDVYLVTAEIEMTQGDRPRRQIKPGSFALLVMEKK